MFKLFRPADAVLLDMAQRTLDGAQTISDVVIALRRSARAIAGADGITVVRRIGDEVAYVDEDAISPLWTGQRFPIRICVSGMAMIERQVIVIPDILADKRVPHNAYLSTFVRSMAMFPIGRDDPHMSMGAYWHEAKPIDPDAIERMTRLADLAADAVARIEASGPDRQDA